MSENLPTLEEWRKLYELMIQVKELAPWTWMEEIDIFGVQNPETDSLGFVSVMGLLGEHYAIGVYPGPEALSKFWKVHDEGPSVSMDQIFEIPQLQASFEDRIDLHKKDHEIIKKLGLKFRGKQAWPMFRSIRPGFAPWFLEAEEARFMGYVLQQVLDVPPRFGEDPPLLKPAEKNEYLIRVPHQKDNILSWKDQYMHVSFPEPLPIPISMDEQMLEALKRLSPTACRFEIDFFMVPTEVREKGTTRPYFPYFLIIVESKGGIVLSSDVLHPVPSLEDMWGLIPMHVIYQLTNFSIVPKEILVRSDLLFQLLCPFSKELNFILKKSPILPNLDHVKNSLFENFF